MGGSLEQIVVGMISIGIAGYLSSSAIRKIDITSCLGAALNQTHMTNVLNTDFESPRKFMATTKSKKKMPNATGLKTDSSSVSSESQQIIR